MFFLLFAGTSLSAWSTHLIGGNLGYTYLGPSSVPGEVRYRIDFSTYIDCTSPNWGIGFPEPVLEVGLYEGAINPSNAMPLVVSTMLNLTDSVPIDPALPPGCNFGSNTCIYLVNYSGLISVPRSSVGYHLIYERCCRPAGIVNLNQSGNQAMSFQAYMPPNINSVPTEINSTPTYTDTLVSYICINDSTFLSNTATDPDGDSLVYSIEQPYWGYTSPTNPVLLPNNPVINPYSYPPPLINWGGGASMAQPFGPGGAVTIDSQTGLTTFLAPMAGIYVIAVEILEYRNGLLIGKSRRDIQLLSVTCPPNPRPNIGGVGTHPNAVNNNTIEIMAGDSVCVDIGAIDPNIDDVDITANGAVFDPNQTNPAATFSPGSGNGQALGEFCWDTDCDQDRPQPYTFTVRAIDDGCPPKSDFSAFNIIVNPYTGPDSIVGPDSICFGNHLGVQYTVPNASKFSFQWSVSGGTIVGSSTDSVVTVDWNINTVGTITLQAVSWKGCTSPPISKNVAVGFSFAIGISDDTIACYNDTLQLGIENNPDLNYVWSPGNDFVNPNVGIAQYIINQPQSLLLTAYDIAGCEDTASVFVDMYPPIINPAIQGPDTLCFGEEFSLNYSTNAGAALFYDWQIINGAITNGANTSAVTVDWNHSSEGMLSVDISDTFGCSLPREVKMIKIGGPIIADAGADTIACDFETVSIGGNGITGLDYSWVPTTNLISPNSPSTDLIVTQGQTYELLVSDSLNCVERDTVVVSKHPPFDVEIFGQTAICEGEPLQLNASDAAFYQWSPDSVLSNAAIQNPVAYPDTTTTFSLLASDSNGCMDSAQLTLSVQQFPDFSLFFDTAYFLGQTGVAEVFTTMDLLFNWSPSTGLSCANCPNPDINADYSTTYTLNITDPSGCFSIDTVFDVTVNRDFNFEVPSAFTPNGDGLNDEARVYTYGIKEVLEFSIFNRWGEMVFTTDKLDRGWNGIYNGQMQPSHTVFAYKVRLKRYTDEEIVQYGKFVLIY